MSAIVPNFEQDLKDSVKVLVTNRPTINRNWLCVSCLIRIADFLISISRSKKSFVQITQQ